MQKLLLACVCAFFSFTLMAQHTISVRGKVNDSAGKPIAYVAVGTRQHSVMTEASGEYAIELTTVNDTVSLVFSVFGYQTLRKQFSFANGAEQYFSPTLQQDITLMPSVTVSQQQEQATDLHIVSSKDATQLPGLSISGAEGVVKTLGARSKSELSSQYSVRGGSYDENLVFVNNIPAMRPNIATSDRQEGLSIINPYMVGSLEFSSGGFGVQYGDRLSSVLNVNYKEVDRNQVQLAASLMDVNLTLQGVTDSAKLSALVGVRYKNTSLMLKTTDEKGEYSPEFCDAQALLSWKMSPKLKLSYWFYAASNKYAFMPQERKTEFGSIGKAFDMSIYFEGNEQYVYQNMGNALSLQYKPTERTFLNAQVLYYRATERETYDVLGQYRLSEIEKDEKGNTRDTAKVLAAGSDFNHARNHLFTNTLFVAHDGKQVFPFFTLSWGANAALNKYDVSYNEWTFIDSALYAMPRNDTAIILKNQRNVAFKHSLQSATVFINGDKRIVFENTAHRTSLRINAGVRLFYDDYSNELLFNPRVRLLLKPKNTGNTTFSLAIGVYYQPVQIKELVGANGTVHYNLKPQRAHHYVVGLGQNLQLWNRPFVLQSELYFKQLYNIIPYVIQNVHTVYFPELLAKGYTVGLDAKLNGEFIPGTESWVSLSILQSRQHLKGDKSSEIRSPNDQRFNISFFVQDYFPSMENLKMSLTYMFGTKIPTAAPSATFEQFDDYTISVYQRVDLGFSWVIFDEKRSNRFIKDMSLGVEVFNLFNNRNKISYFWLEDVSGKYYAVPNYLTLRRLNVKFLITL